MDDLTSGFTQNYTPQQVATMAEMERKAQDRIRVCNITDNDFTVLWGGLGFIVPGKNSDMGHGPGQQILPRYIAINYVTKMIDKILGERMVQAVRDANNLRASRGMPELNKWQEQGLIENQFRIDNQDMRKKILPYLWVGVEEEWGMDMSPEATSVQRQIDSELIARLEQPAQKLESLPTLDPSILTPASVPPSPLAPTLNNPENVLPLSNPSPIQPTMASVAATVAAPPPSPSPVDQLLSSVSAPQTNEPGPVS